MDAPSRRSSRAASGEAQILSIRLALCTAPTPLQSLVRLRGWPDRCLAWPRPCIDTLPPRRWVVSVAAITEGQLLWEPSPSFKEHSVIAEYMRWLGERHGRRFADYAALWQWSVTDLEAFWSSIVEFFGVEFQRPAERIL